MENDKAEFSADSSDGETEVPSRPSITSGPRSSWASSGGQELPASLRLRLPTRRSAQFRVLQPFASRARARSTCRAHEHAGDHVYVPIVHFTGTSEELHPFFASPCLASSRLASLRLEISAASIYLLLRPAILLSRRPLAPSPNLRSRPINAHEFAKSKNFTSNFTFSSKYDFLNIIMISKRFISREEAPVDKLR